MKNNIDFYQHYATADQHPKFKMLRVEFGWEGEGKFWALNNRIAQAENCCLDISKKYNKAAIANDLDFNIKGFDEFIEYLLNDCELIRECSPGTITTDIVQENFERVMVNREKARERKQRSLEKVSKGSGEQSKSSGERNKKVKESKVNNIYTPNFLKFWEQYPKKTGKGEAFKSYKKILEPKPTLKQILDSLELHKKTEQWKDKQFIPNPSTWINQRRWEDEFETDTPIKKEDILQEFGFDTVA